MVFMNKRKIYIFLFSVLILVLACAACGAGIQTAADTIVVSEVSAADMPNPSADEQSAPSNSTEPAATPPDNAFVFPFSSIAELDAEAVFVATGECISVEAVFQNDMLYTVSQVRVDQVLKGDVSQGDIVLFGEYGGRVTNGEYTEGTHIDKKPFADDAPTMPDDQQVNIGIDGFYPFQQSEQALIFATDISGFLEDVDAPLYGFVGGYYGKLLLRDDGSYARPPSETDKDIYKDSFVIALDELKQYYQK